MDLSVLAILYVAVTYHSVIAPQVPLPGVRISFSI
jgi:hypothetical protein